MIKFHPKHLVKLAGYLDAEGVTFDARSDEHSNFGEHDLSVMLKRRAAGRRAYAEICREAATRLTAKAKRAGFAAPRLQEVIDYAAQGENMRNWPDKDIEQWWNHFESVGWRVNTKPMVDWKAAAANGYRRWLKDNPQAAPKTAATKADPEGWREYLKANGRSYKPYGTDMQWVRAEFNETRK